MKANPLRMNKNEKIAIGVGVAAGLAAMIYYLTRPATPVPSAHAAINQLNPPAYTPPSAGIGS